MTIISVYCFFNVNIMHTAATFSTLQKMKQQFRSKKHVLPIPLNNSDTLTSTYETVYSEDPVDYAYPNDSFVNSTDLSSSNYNPVPTKPSHKKPLVPHGAAEVEAANYEVPYSKDPVDYTYPNNSFMTSTDPSSSHYTSAPSIKPSHKKPLVPHRVAEVEAANYEVPNSKDPVDYTYPNHSFTTSTDPSSIYHTPAPSPKPSHKQPLLPHGATAIIPSNYEIPNSKDPEDYTYSVSTLKTDSSSNGYAYPTSPKAEAATDGSDKGVLYHSVGPSVKLWPTGGKGNKSIHPPSLNPNLPPVKPTGQEGFYHTLEESLEDVSVLYGGKGNKSTHPLFLTPNLPPKKSTGHEGFYHTLEESLEDDSVLYEDPTLPKFRVRRINVVHILCKIMLLQFLQCTFFFIYFFYLFFFY